MESDVWLFSELGISRYKGISETVKEREMYEGNVSSKCNSASQVEKQSRLLVLIDHVNKQRMQLDNLISDVGSASVRFLGDSVPEHSCETEEKKSLCGEIDFLENAISGLDDSISGLSVEISRFISGL